MLTDKRNFIPKTVCKWLIIAAFSSWFFWEVFSAIQSSYLMVVSGHGHDIYHSVDTFDIKYSQLLNLQIGVGIVFCIGGIFHMLAYRIENRGIRSSSSFNILISNYVRLTKDFWVENIIIYSAIFAVCLLYFKQPAFAIIMSIAARIIARSFWWAEEDDQNRETHKS